jgi:hypothetical protein
MIDINKLKAENKGRKVVFKGFNGSTKTGIVAGWDKKFIYVDYSNGLNKDRSSIPTNPGKLSWSSPSGKKK